MDPLERLVADIQSADNIVQIVDAILRNDFIAALPPRERESVNERIIDAVKERTQHEPEFDF